MKYIYVAGAYTKGDVVENVRNAVLEADELVKLGFVPFVPHLTHLWHTICPHPYQYWMEYDNEWLKRCDALLRLPGESAGADVEEKVAKSLGMPVFYSVQEVIDYARINPAD